MRKLKVFFITCAAVFVVGMVMLFAGIGTGGVEGFEAVAEDHDWISTGTGARATVDVTDLEFDSIEVTGVADVVIVGEDSYSEVIHDYNLETVLEPKAGTAIGIFGSKAKGPDFVSDGGTLKITAGEVEEFEGINLDFSSDGVYPTIIVFCPDKQLDQIRISSSYSDVELRDISFKHAEVLLNYGDVEMENVVSEGIKVETDSGDTELSGELKGLTDVSAEAGDIEVDTKDPTKEYTMKLKTSEGDINIGEEDVESLEEDEEGYSYTQSGGENTLILKTDVGDIEISPLDPHDL